MRVQLDMTSEQVEHLEQLMKDTSIGSKRDLFDYALTLFEWAIEERKTGKQIGSYDEHENFRVLLLPPLQKVGRRPAAKHDFELVGTAES